MYSKSNQLHAPVSNSKKFLFQRCKPRSGEGGGGRGGIPHSTEMYASAAKNNVLLRLVRVINQSTVFFRVFLVKQIHRSTPTSAGFFRLSDNKNAIKLKPFSSFCLYQPLFFHYLPSVLIKFEQE